MKQPELGIKINEIRSQQGMTQRTLSESSGVDIRTIQRIEAGEVVPRASTLQLIAGALSVDIAVFNAQPDEMVFALSSRFLLVISVVGLAYFLAWILVSPVTPKTGFIAAAYLFLIAVYLLAGMLFYYGFSQLGKYLRNSLIKITSAVFVVCIPIFIISLFVASEMSYAKHLNQLVVWLMALNSAAFGVGLFRVHGAFKNLYRFTGIVLFAAAPFVILSGAVVAIFNFWLVSLSIILQVGIVFAEYRKLRHS